MRRRCFIGALSRSKTRRCRQSGCRDRIVVAVWLRRRRFATRCEYVGRSETRRGVGGSRQPGANAMWSWADRMVKAVSNVTVGTVIVLVHVALAERNRRSLPAGTPPERRVV